jgi:hypothetical protein
MQDSIFDKAKDSVSALKDKVSEFKDDLWGDEQKQLMDDWKEGGINKARESLESIGNSTALFIKSGYELNGVTINLGLPPVIVSDFHYLKDISDEERAAVLAEVKSSKIVHLLITCLLKARDFFEKVKVGDYKMNIVSVTIGLTPGITITFNRES